MRSKIRYHWICIPISGSAYKLYQKFSFMPMIAVWFAYLDRVMYW